MSFKIGDRVEAMVFVLAIDQERGDMLVSSSLVSAKQRPQCRNVPKVQGAKVGEYCRIPGVLTGTGRILSAVELDRSEWAHGEKPIIVRTETVRSAA